MGAVIVGIVGAFLGTLVGTGSLPLPGLEPGTIDRNGLFLFMSILRGLMAGELTGVILGIAWRLWKSREKAEVTTGQIDKRGVQGESKARREVKEHAALEVGNRSKKWNVEVWTGSDETNPSLQHLAKSR